MNFIKPKSVKKKVSWNISEDTITIINNYVKYTQYEEEEIVDIFMKNLLNDDKFIEWIKKQRNSKKIDSVLKNNGIINELNKEDEDGSIKEAS